MRTDSFRRLPEIRGEDDTDTTLLLQMAREARAYISAFKWCPPIRAIFLAYGVGGVVGVFLFEFSRKIGGTDSQLWVIVGDLPSVYMVVEPDDSAAYALERYCDLMQDWADAVENKADLTQVFPVPVEATDENARELRSRIEFLREEIIPAARE